MMRTLVDKRERTPGAFPSTRRSALLGALSDDPALRKSSWERIARAYLEPVYAYVRLRFRLDEERTRDLVQSFFEHILTKEVVGAYDADKARFRTFIKVCLDRFVIDAQRAERSQKRGGGALALDFDSAQEWISSHQDSDQLDPDAAFDAAWTRHVLGLAIDALREHCRAQGKDEHLSVFERFHLGDADDAPSYEAVARELGTTVVTVQNRLAYARRHFRRLTLEILRELTANEDELRFEARAVLGVEL